VHSTSPGAVNIAGRGVQQASKQSRQHVASSMYPAPLNHHRRGHLTSPGSPLQPRESTQNARKLAVGQLR
jgi:hypothetical protein